jgi:hypothetical protein
MRSRKCRQGTKKWRNSGHKSREWHIAQSGTSGIREWERNGKR